MPALVTRAVCRAAPASPVFQMAVSRTGTGLTLEPDAFRFPSSSCRAPTWPPTQATTDPRPDAPGASPLRPLGCCLLFLFFLLSTLLPRAWERGTRA